MLSATSGPRRRLQSLRRVAALLGVLALTGCTELVHGSAQYAPAGSDGLVLQEPCPDSPFECVTLGVPADHFTPGSPTWRVTFALHRATGESRGVLVTATGGPGSSGISGAGDRLAFMPREITAHYDVVFFDQRGVGLSERFRCDEAYATGGMTIDDSATPAERDTFAAVTEQFASDCFDEAGVDPADAALFSTRQAAEDLESFRDWLGADKLLLYGESYGTQFQQTYATAHPDRVAALMLDGVVDLSTDLFGFGLQAAQAYSDVLAAVLTACDADEPCADDAPGTAVGQYDTLAARLSEGPVTFDYPLPDGTTEQRALTLDDLRGAATSSVSDPVSRMFLQQALNAAALDDFVPLARLATAGWADPDTGAVLPDPTFSDAMYYAVQCADYDVVPEGSSGRAQLDFWLDTAHAAGVDDLRLGDVAYGDLPCLFWPDGGGVPTRPEPVTDPPYPLLLLTADTDPNTPVQNAEQVFDRTVDDVSLVLLQGGPHVIYGRGDPCVDNVVEAVITTGKLPSPGRTVCPGEVAWEYMPNPPATADDYRSGEETVDAVISAVLNNPAYAGWYGPDNLVLGCDGGGTVRYLMTEDQTVNVWLAGCEWTDGVPVNGYLSVADDGAGDISATLALPFATLSLGADGTVSGEFRGRAVR